MNRKQIIAFVDNPREWQGNLYTLGVEVAERTKDRIADAIERQTEGLGGAQRTLADQIIAGIRNAG